MSVAVISDMTRKRFVTTVILLFGAGSCGGEAGSGVIDGGVADSESSDPCANLACRPTTTVSWPAKLGVYALDILIVVDDRVPSGPAAATYAKTMQDLADTVKEQISEGPLKLANLHIALVTSNQPTTPMLLWPEIEACQKPTGAFLQTSLLCEAPTNFQGPFADILTCASANVYPSGRPSRPLETLHALLAPGGLAETTGFRRPEATLLLAVITSEDDPALADPSAQGEHRDFIIHLVQDPENLAVSVVAPRNAKGLSDFTSSFWAFFEELEADTWINLPGLAGPAHYYLKGNCFRQVELVPSAISNGQKATCLVRRRDTSPDGHSVERVIPECILGTSTETTCWRAVRDEIRCPSRPSLAIRLVIHDPPPACRAPDVVTYTGTCATAQ
jgi:hypothetical protein